MACAGIGAGEERTFFLKFDAERGSSIFSVSGGGGGGGMAFDEDAGPPRERNEGLIALLRRRGLKSKLAGWLYRIQIEGI